MSISRCRFATTGMTDDPLDARKARCDSIQYTLLPWLRQDVAPLTDAFRRLVTLHGVIRFEAFLPEPPLSPGRPEARRISVNG